MWGKRDEPAIHIDFNNRPVVGICECGKLLRGRTDTLPADRIYTIKGERFCRECALRWFDSRFEMTDVL